MAFAPYVVRHIVFKLGPTASAKEFAAEVSDAQLIPAATVQTWQGSTPASQYSDVGPATWTAQIVFAQDYEEALSLATFLFENEGETIEAHFEPQAGGTGFDADLIITPGTIGGAVNAYAEATVTLGVQGKPVKTPATPLDFDEPDLNEDFADEARASAKDAVAGFSGH